jgi:hypothetical protein
MWRCRGCFCQLELTIWPLRSLDRRRRVRREVADIEHRPQQRRFRQHGPSLCNHVRGRMLAALGMVMQQGLDLGHALADFPDRATGHRTPHLGIANVTMIRGSGPGPLQDQV